MMPRTRKTRLQLATGASVWDQGRSRGVVVEFVPAVPNLLTVRLEGTRRRYSIDTGDLYVLAVRKTIEAEKRERAKARKARKA
jgi:hypothetical protein